MTPISAYRHFYPELYVFFISDLFDLLKSNVILVCGQQMVKFLTVKCFKKRNHFKTIALHHFSGSECFSFSVTTEYRANTEDRREDNIRGNR